MHIYSWLPCYNGLPSLSLSSTSLLGHWLTEIMGVIKRSKFQHVSPLDNPLEYVYFLVKPRLHLQSLFTVYLIPTSPYSPWMRKRIWFQSTSSSPRLSKLFWLLPIGWTCLGRQPLMASTAVAGNRIKEKTSYPRVRRNVNAMKIVCLN